MREPVEVVCLNHRDESVADGLSVRRWVPDAVPIAWVHAHEFHQVTLILSSPGRLDWRMGEGRMTSRRPSAGDLVICPAHVPTLVRWDRPFESLSVRITTDLLDRVADKAGLPSNPLTPRLVRRDDFVATIARKLADEASGLLAESLGTALAVHLLREYSGEPAPKRPEARLAPEALRRVTAEIDSHLAGNLSIDRLAALAGLSPFHFLRCFRGSTGSTPRQYIIGRRVEHARGRILGGSTIAQAAFEAGFSGQSHLHQHLRRLHGITPGELVRRRDSSAAPHP